AKGEVLRDSAKLADEERERATELAEACATATRAREHAIHMAQDLPELTARCEVAETELARRWIETPHSTNDMPSAEEREYVASAAATLRIRFEELSDLVAEMQKETLDSHFSRAAIKRL